MSSAKSKEPKRPPMSVKEATAYLKKGPKTIYRWVARGLIRKSPHSRHLLLNRNDVEALGEPT
jgi:excisionase family DNA binding protein